MVRSDSYYGVDEVIIQHKQRENYPEGGFGTEINIDMCPDCFTNKLLPWLKSQGCKVEYTEWDC